MRIHRYCEHILMSQRVKLLYKDYLYSEVDKHQPNNQIPKLPITTKLTVFVLITNHVHIVVYDR